MLLKDGGIALSAQNSELVAVVPALAVAVVSRSLIGTVVTGVVAVALLPMVIQE